MDTEETTFRFVGQPPTMEELEEGLKTISSPSDYTREEYRMMMELDKSLSEILTEKILPLTVLFPEDPAKPSASKVYESQNKQQSLAFPATAQRIAKHMENAINPQESQCQPIYRILEIGAGTGRSTKGFLECITANTSSSRIEYFFTDVSAAFFKSDIEKELKEFGISVVFRKYDMDKDPLEQGLCPEYFDLVMAFEVLHAARDIKKTMKNVRSLMKPGGLIVIYETICPDERITFAFGLLEGYWQFEDRDFRKYHTTLSPRMWKEAINQAGFHGTTVLPMYNSVHGFISAFAAPVKNTFLVDPTRPPANSWLIFGENDDLCQALQGRLLNVNRKCEIIPLPVEFTEVSMVEYLQKMLALSSKDDNNLEGIIYLWSLSPETRNQTKVSLPFMALMKLVAELRSQPKTFAVMRGTCDIESSEVSDPTSATLVGFCKSLSNENARVNVTFLDLDPNKEAVDQLEELFMNLWVEHRQGAAFRDGLRLHPKFTAAKIARNERLTLPSGCDRYQLILPKTRLISDLEFAYLEPFNLGDNELEVEVKAIGLNFRDVFTVLKPIPIFDTFDTVGIDFGGVVARVGAKVTRVKVGDRVSGLVNNGISVPSHQKIDERDLIPLPDWVTFAEGTAFPAAFCTIVLFLIRLAKLKKGETVLVHTASGGVGLVAVQICQHFGAKMIATAGSRRKRAYLRSLGVEHVFHSRTVDFKDEILRVTGGRGVNVVLNTLTGPGFKEASLESLSHKGRFIEMSKLNVWTKEEVRMLRPDVFYELVDLSEVDMSVIRTLTDELVKMVAAGSIRPIAYERFDALNIRGALTYMLKANHIGKIVCVMPEVKLERSKLIVSTPLFNHESTYLITGGLGGIGYEVVKWMLRNGAKHIAILSRSTPKPEIAMEIDSWNKTGKHVKAFQVDVGNHDQLKSLLEDLKNPAMEFPLVRGVMHAAGVLQDALLENQSWDKFTQTYNPKVYGSWNLHDLTKDCVLEHFVLFSSIAAKFGSPGQTNHSASNAFEDSLAAYRKSIGLPATSVNWGNWGEVGVATEIDFPGIRPISTAQGLLALETFLRTQTDRMSVLNVESFSMVLKLFPQVKHYVDDVRLFGENKASVILMNSDEFWNEVDTAPDKEGKMDCFKKLIKTVIRNILKMDKDDTIEDETEFQVLGIDSLMVLEMKNGLQNILGGRMVLSANQLKGCNNTQLLAERLVSILESTGDGDDVVLSHDELKQLIRDDSSLLSETLSSENLKGKPIQEVETVLLTGVTGNMGPYILSELMHRAQVKKVYCLVRVTSDLPGIERLKVKLEETQLMGKVDLSKVEVLLGDITTPKFGLTNDKYFILCEQVDAIVHCAVKIDSTAKYWKAPESNISHVRTVNVLGTARLLEFAGERKLKHFFHASGFFAFTGTGNNEQFSEGWQDVSALDNNAGLGSFGYVISKHICEQLVQQAISKGIPCKAFRFPIITGDSKTGKVNYLQNHAIQRWITFMKVGAVHDISMPFTAVPVDHCAKISLDIFFNPEAPMDVYNIVQKSLEVEQVLVEVAESFGIKMEIVPYDRFMKMVKEEAEDSPISEFVKLYVDKESELISMFESQSNLALKKYFETESLTLLETSKLEKYAPEYEKLLESASNVLKRDFTYLRKEGVFEKYGIQTSS